MSAEMAAAVEPDEPQETRATIIVWYENPRGGAPKLAALRGADISQLAYAAHLFNMTAIAIEGGGVAPAGRGDGYRDAVVDITADMVALALVFEEDGSIDEGISSLAAPPTAHHFVGAALCLDELARNQLRTALDSQAALMAQSAAARRRILGGPDGPRRAN